MGFWRRLSMVPDHLASRQFPAKKSTIGLDGDAALAAD
jgi:hypothetical protein